MGGGGAFVYEKVRQMQSRVLSRRRHATPVIPFPHPLWVDLERRERHDGFGLRQPSRAKVVQVILKINSRRQLHYV